MGTPVHNKKQQITYLKQRMNLIQSMLEQMEDSDSLHKPDIERLEKTLNDTAVKIKQFKQDWNEEGKN